jgi:trehalose 6-phosphate phosphatase
MTERNSGEGGMLFYQMTGFMGREDAPGGTPFDLPPPERASLLLDFDGTLVEIAERPDAVVVPERVPALLDLALRRLEGRVALISGRTIADLERFLPGFGGALVGAHGAEFRLDGERSQVGDIDLEIVKRLQRLVRDYGDLVPGFLVEDKPTGVVLHFRQAEEKSGLALRFMESVANAAEGFRLQPALMAFELKPCSVGKDVAMRRLLESPPFAGHLPVVAGDDLTDEPALALAQERDGVAVKIGQAETVARHRLAGPEALIDRLEEWLA